MDRPNSTGSAAGLPLLPTMGRGMVLGALVTFAASILAPAALFLVWIAVGLGRLRYFAESAALASCLALFLSFLPGLMGGCLNGLILWALSQRRWRSRAVVCAVGVVSGFSWALLAYVLTAEVMNPFGSAFSTPLKMVLLGSDGYGIYTLGSVLVVAALVGCSHSLLLVRYLKHKAKAAHSEINAQVSASLE